MLPLTGDCEPTARVAVRPRFWSGPALFGLVGALTGVIALATVVTANCARLKIPQCQHQAAAVMLLPQFDAGRYLVSTNPLQPGGLAADLNQLLDAIPATDRPRARSFIAGSRAFADKLAQARPVPSCGYQTGELNLRLYQDRAAPWSAGLAVVVPGRLTGVFDPASPCFLGGRIASMIDVGLSVGSSGAGADGAAPAFCDAQPAGPDHTLLTLGSTVAVCADLAGIPALAVSTVTSPDTVVRPGATIGGAPTLRVRPGTAGTVLCQQAGWARVTFPAGTPDPVTGKSIEDEHTGYVAVGDLDAGASLAQQVPACPPPTSPVCVIRELKLCLSL